MEDKELDEILSSLKKDLQPDPDPVTTPKKEARPPQRRTSTTAAAERQKREAARKKAKRKRKTTTGFLIGLSVALFILIVFLIFHFAVPSAGDGDELKGTWRYDNVTVYEFDGVGHGALVLPLNTYDFTYTVSDGKISIDFESESAKDSDYTYTVKGNTLTLVNAGGATFELTKD